MPKKILAVHGLGDHRDGGWILEWRNCIADQVSFPDGFELIAFSYDDIFERVDISFNESLRAMAKLLGSGIQSWWKDYRRSRTFGARGAPRGVLQNAQDRVRWTAGYVVAWCEDEQQFRRKVRGRLLKVIATEKPDIVVAHSLGSLITFDTLTHPEVDAATKKAIRRLTFVTIGSQLGNPFVRNRLNGSLRMPSVEKWFNLYNAEDDVFTASIAPYVQHKSFYEVETYFNLQNDWSDHNPAEYLKHPRTKAVLWRHLNGLDLQVRVVTGTARDTARPDSLEQSVFELPTVRRNVLDIPPQEDSTIIDSGVRREPRRRALLVGINDYPNPDDRLEGCVNDVYLISSVLQEFQQFEPEDIRIVLNERATAEGILERLHWLFDDPQPDDVLLFYYSGHGAQIPAYGKDDEIDEYDETLVPYDFNWNLETAVTDDTIYDLYVGLKDEIAVYLIFDCCHSGSMHRAGMPRVRGLAPPADIYHRALLWDGKRWRRRDAARRRSDFALTDDTDAQRAYVGTEGDLYRIGRGLAFRPASASTYARLKKRRTKDPKSLPTTDEGCRNVFLPTILEACREHEFAYEHREGPTSYGAFTFFAAQVLRERPNISPEELGARVGETLLEELGLEQHPEVLAPPTRLSKPIFLRTTVR